MRSFTLFVALVLLLECFCFGQIPSNPTNETSSATTPTFSLVANATASPIRVGDAININITVTNISGKEIYWIFDKGKNATYKVFAVSLMKDGKEVETTFFHRKITGRQRANDPVEVESGSSNPVPYPPGKMFVLTIDLKRLYEITQPGVYTLEVSRYDEYNKTTVRANSLTLKIVP